MRIKFIGVKIWKTYMRCIYFFFKKLLKTKNKITFMSRQTNGRNLDFDLIIEELRKRDKNVEIVVLNKRLEKDWKSKIIYALHMFKQMYHMATSKVIIIDSYAILVSILKQKEDTKVIQIWHALGSLKKFGYSILGRKEGRNPKTAEIMDMHKNNDYILTSSEISKKHFMEAFRADEEQMIVLGLPRIDFLQSKKKEKEVRKQFCFIYEETYNGKEIILYAPTDRKAKSINLNKVINSVNYEKYNLIIKTHSGREIVYVNKKKVERGNNFLGIELLHVADYIITDYSAIVYEASLVNKPIYFYAYDYDEYMKNRGVYIDYKKEMPGIIAKDIKNIMNAIETKTWNPNKVNKFANKYISNRNINITESIVDLIFEQMSTQVLTKEEQEILGESSKEYAGAQNRGA